MKQLIRAYWLLDAVKRRQAWLMIGVATAMALFDTLGTFSVMPFLAVITNQDLIQKSHLLSLIYTSLGFSTARALMFFLGLTSFFLLLLSAVVRIFGQYLMNRFTQMCAYSVSQRLMEFYLRRPYGFFLTHNTSDLAKNLLSDIFVLQLQIFQPAVVLLSQGVLLVVLLSLVFAVNPSVALVGITTLGACYAVIYLSIRGHFGRIGYQRDIADWERFRVTSEAFGGIKPVKLLGSEQYYLRRFSEAALRLARNQATATTLGIVPRYAMEAIAFGGVILLALTLMLRDSGNSTDALNTALPLLGLYVFAGYRTLPAIQGIYNSLTQFHFGVAAIDNIEPHLLDQDDLPELPAAPVQPLPFTREVGFHNVGFRHESALTSSLSGIHLTIAKGSTLGIVGPTGAGKTTLVDIFLGLLKPTVGEIVVDGIAVTDDNVRSWQAGLGYVPQDIFLTDATVAENIALGVARPEIDLARVRECLRLAQLLNFVERDLPEGLDTLVGERGIRLSGGQRQRIGIARALYPDPSLLVFDEATSALDNHTEREVVGAINALAGSRTILIVAHRISTVMNCNQILVLEQGKPVGLGTYEDLYQENPTFRQLVGADSRVHRG
ncbi:ABC transporter ATP-binding protein [Solirhodobacter olei]|uniref:ABC transporter ATP-binding protein n=1 Tax=Solirhodobacter olei TaxID=2493082 RepID=UPI000FD7F5D3|nr:ABC transporter ATP-binding protein [Solirhodobacter olei]